MKAGLLIAAILLLPRVAAGQQAIAVEAFTELRNETIEDARGEPLHAKVALSLGLHTDVRIVQAATLSLALRPGRRVLTLAFSVNTTDVIFMESQTRSTGTVMTVFHAEHPSLALRAAASGTSNTDLQRLPVDHATHAFADVLETWARALPKMRANR